MKRLLLILLFAAMAGTIGWLLARPNPDRGKVALIEQEILEARAEIQRLKSDLHAAANPPSEVPPVVSPTSPPPNAGTEPKPEVAKAPEGKDAKKPGNALREMMQAPGMKAMIQSQQRSQLGIQYGRLMEMFGLDDEERAHFEDLLLKKQADQVDFGLKMMEEGITSEDRKKLSTELAAADKATDEEIRQFLNDENDWKTYQNWEDTKPERIQLEMFGRSLFDSSGQPLSQEQESQLIQTMTDVRKTPPAANQPAMPKPDSLDGFSTADIEHLISQQQQNQQEVIERSSAFLSPAQIDTLRKFHEQQLSMTETGLRMSSMFLPTAGDTR